MSVGLKFNPTHTVVPGFLSAFFMILFGYIPTLDYDPTVSFWLQLFVFSAMILSLAKYFQNGIMKISSLRNLEELVNEIERSKRFEHLQELL